MKLAGERRVGGMAAVLGLDVDRWPNGAPAPFAETGTTSSVANDNRPG